MKSLNLGPRLDNETGHDHQNDEHAEHDHRGLRQKSRREQRSTDERNTTWDEVKKKKQDGRQRSQEQLTNINSFNHKYLEYIL